MNTITRRQQFVNSHNHVIDYRTLYFDSEADAAAYDASLCKIPARGLDMSKVAKAQADSQWIRERFAR
jgi:hypothetical protein